MFQLKLHRDWQDCNVSFGWRVKLDGMNSSLVLGMGWFQLCVRLEGWNGSILCLVGGTGKDEIKAQSDTAMVGSTCRSWNPRNSSCSKPHWCLPPAPNPSNRLLRSPIRHVTMDSLLLLYTKHDQSPSISSTSSSPSSNCQQQLARE